MLVVLAIVGILLGLALPSYQQHQRTVRRGDARAALQQVQLEQARYRSVNERYASSLAELGWANDLSPARAYRLHISQASAEGYEVQALPLGAQAADRACQPMRLTLLPNASVVYGSGEQADADPGRCWP